MCKLNFGVLAALLAVKNGVPI